MLTRMSITAVGRAMAILLIVALIGGAPAFAQDTVKVAQVAIAGNQNINADTIQNSIKLKVGDDYTEQATNEDRAAIMQLGYFVAVTVHKEDVPGGIKVTYEVTENPKINDVKIIGSDPIPAAELLAIMKTKPGQVLNTLTLNQDIEEIQGHYTDKGYIAYVTADVGVDSATGVLTIPVLVHTVESVQITGAKKTKDYVFLREMKTKPGTIFNINTLKADILKIYNLDILEDVKQYQIQTGAEMGQVRVILPVQEKKTGQVSVGVGYSSRQRLVGQARLSETNFRGRGQGLNLLWEQGTVNAVGGPASYEIGFYEPWVDKQHTSLSVSAYNRVVYRFASGVFGSTTISDETYSERHRGADLTLSRPISEPTRIYFGGRFDDVENDEDLLGQTGDLYKIAQSGTIGVGSVKLVHNTRDFDLDPASGGYNAVSLEVGSTDAVRFVPVVEGTGFQEVPFSGWFNKASFDIRRYFSRGGPKTKPDDKRVTLAVRFRGGIASGTLPFFEQFFVGGGESLRGYREDRFWGNNMLLASIELRKPIAQAISGVLFLDYGDAWDGDPVFDITELPQTEGFKGHYGVGVGMRVTTPIGHLRLDYGIGTEGGRTHFSMGHAF